LHLVAQKFPCGFNGCQLVQKAACNQTATMQVVENIVDELRRIDPRIEKQRAAEHVHTVIRALRSEYAYRRDRPSPREIREAITKAAKNAGSLLSNLRNLPADMRERVSIPTKRGTVSFSQWIDDLEAVSKSLRLKADLGADGRWSTEMDVTCAAVELISTLAPSTNFATLPKTSGSPFYLIVDYLWEAVSGHQQDLKRYCDTFLNAARNGRAELNKKYVVTGP
jgi:hypothetical protein